MTALVCLQRIKLSNRHDCPPLDRRNPSNPSYVTMPPMRIDALLLDLDDTLIPDESAAEAAFLAACAPVRRTFRTRPRLRRPRSPAPARARSVASLGPNRLLPVHRH